MGRFVLLAQATALVDVDAARGGSKRERFPFAASRMDEFTDVFGPGVRVEYAREGDDEYGQRLLEQEIGVPFRVMKQPTMPTAGCACSACNPKPSVLKRRQKEPGGPFGLDNQGRFRQPTTYRAEFAEERFQHWL